MKNDTMPPYDWFSEQWQRFVHARQNGSLTHAQLLVGSDGIGLADLARAEAQYLLCQSPQDTRACGVCKSCRLYQHEHPDLVVVGTEDGSSAIKIDQIRALSDFILQTAQQGGAKVILIEQPEKMNINAANALLKNLEEPPANTFFLLVCYAPSRVLPTIRSRCVQVLCPTPSPMQVKKWLDEQKLDVPEALLKEAGGAPLTALQWLNEGDAAKQRELYYREFTAFLQGNADISQTAQRCAKADIGFLLGLLVQNVQHAIRCHYGEQAINEVDHCLSQSPPLKLFSLLEQLQYKKRSVEVGANLNAQMLLEELLLDLNIATSA